MMDVDAGAHAQFTMHCMYSVVVLLPLVHL